MDAAPSVRLVGRFEPEAEGARFAWTGSAVVARFRGTSVTLKLRDFASDPNAHNHFTVVVDGVLKPRLEVDPTHESYVVATGLAEGEHTVRVTRDTEAFVGEDLFLGFDFGAGVLLAPPNASGRTIEMVGDSITCGYGIEGANETCHFTTGTENGTLAYGTLAAAALGAEVVTQCWSGRGVYRNNDGDLRAENLVPALAQKALPTRATDAWPFTAYAPDAVVVNLSTNDFDAGHTIPGKTEFTGAYRAFFDKLRAHYPKAHLFAASSPMLSNSYPANEGRLDIANGYLKAVVDGMTASGDTRVHYVKIDVRDAADAGLGCDYHPSRKRAQVMAATLTTEIRKALAW